MTMKEIIQRTIPASITVGQVVIKDSEKIKKIFSEFIVHANYNCQEIMTAIRTKGQYKFTDGEDAITVQY